MSSLEISANTSTDDRFKQVLQRMQETHDRKQQDYGTKGDEYANLRSAEHFGIPAWVGTLIRQLDKIKRIQSFVKKGKLVNESVEDSLLDNAVYSVLAYVLYMETKQGEHPQD